MARVGDAEGREVEGTYLDPDGIRDLIRQLHGIVLLLDGMADSNGDNGSAASPYGKDTRVTGARYLTDRNATTLRDTRRAVLNLAAKYRDLLDGAVRMVDSHVESDSGARDDVRNAGG
ncbi:MAG: hypothetical protein ACRDUA_11270 [Micromonosporaceae bacterium]